MKAYTQLADIQADLRAGVLRCEDLVRNYLAAIAARPEINAFLEVFEAEIKQSCI